MKLTIDFYTAWKHLGTDRGMEVIKESGFDGIDMSFVHSDATGFFLSDDYMEKAQTVKKCLHKHGLHCSQAHAPIECYYGMNFDDSCPEYVRVKRAIESASLIGIKYLVVEGIEAPAPHCSYLNLDCNYEFYKSLEPHLKKHGVILAIENLRKSFTYPDLMNEILKRLCSPCYKALVDIGHCWVRADMQPGEYIRALEHGSICALHVHDTHGIRQGIDEHLLPWLGEIDFDDMINALKDIGYCGNISLELRPFIEKYASRGLLKPALVFAEAVGRKLISMFENDFIAKQSETMQGR